MVTKIKRNYWVSQQDLKNEKYIKLLLKKKYKIFTTFFMYKAKK